MSQHSSDEHPSTRALVLGALGIVFGDIGTSPLYALKECFYSKHHALAVTAPHVLGILSLIFWSLILIVSVKYLIFVMRAGRNGEGGILALLALATSARCNKAKSTGALLMLGVFGAALLYGDGIITPAISVLSAVEGLNQGLKMPPDEFQKYVTGITLVILIGLFSFQRIGTEKVGGIFGPVTLLWFATLGMAGIAGIVRAPEVLASFNPWHGFHFLLHSGWHGFLVLGSVFLVVTGGEALYADMGHFGVKPIRIGWFVVVLPALMLNYLGQGALLLTDPAAVVSPELIASATWEGYNPFFRLIPGWALYPVVGLATAATVIASQALITGTYSLTLQAIQLGYLPRFSIRHTSAHTRGQIYIPAVNWLLMLACIGLVIGFKSSSNLASAYGIAVTMTMVITTLLFYFAARSLWGWKVWQAAGVCTVFLVGELAFFAANAMKVLDGGWFPLTVGLVLFIIMTTWQTGRRLLSQEMDKSSLSQEEFLESLKYTKTLVRVQGTAVFMSGNSGKAPGALLHNLKHNKVLHETVIFLTIVTDNVPYITPGKQVELIQLQEGFYRLTGHYGYLQEPDVPQLLRRARGHGLECKADHATFFLGRETIVPSTQLAGMAIWREHLFAFLSRVAQAPSSYFRLPEGRVVELGMRVRI